MKFKFKYRDQVEDTVTGVKGVVIGVHQWNNGCVRYSIQRMPEKGETPPPADLFDEQDLSMLDEASTPIVTDDIFKFGFLDDVRDVISGYKGKVLCRTYWNGYMARYAIQGKAEKGKAPPDMYRVDEQELTLLKAAAKPKAKPAGGPRNDERRGLR